MQIRTKLNNLEVLGCVAAVLLAIGLTVSCTELTQASTAQQQGQSPLERDDEAMARTEVREERPQAEGAGDYLEAYALIDEDFGTETVVSVGQGVRRMKANALPNHATGEFPNAGNPNAIRAQDVLYEIPLEPIYIGTPRFARQPGVALNGVKFEPQTAERVTCNSGEVYSIEAFQDLLDLGFDFNNAHVQPTGEYHYHGVSDLLVDIFSGEGDLVHVGFALDGHLMYYSKSGAYASSYTLSTEPRTGTACSYRNPFQTLESHDLAGSLPDGSFVSDWQYVEGLGDLDECNGTEINGAYAYIISEEYPYVSRCLMGEFTRSGPGGGGRPPAGAPPRP